MKGMQAFRTNARKGSRSMLNISSKSRYLLPLAFSCLAQCVLSHSQAGTPARLEDCNVPATAEP
jgi:hypothetical protein